MPTTVYKFSTKLALYGEEMCYGVRIDIVNIKKYFYYFILRHDMTITSEATTRITKLLREKLYSHAMEQAQWLMRNKISSSASTYIEVEKDI